MIPVLMALTGSLIAVGLGVAAIVFACPIVSPDWTPEERERFVGPDR